MRVAPAGLFYSKERSFEMAVEFAALTHGHPSGYLSAGVLASIIASITNGSSIESAIEDASVELTKHENHQECYQAIQEAVDLSHSSIDPREAISKLGEGWVGEETLSISIYCALKYKDDFKKAIITSVNHNGDSDSTGAVTGNILGAYLGMDAIPKEWINKVELKDEIIQIADDLLSRYQEGGEWCNKYPGC
jgi:ADP-ribosylglycohydrolase